MERIENIVEVTEGGFCIGCGACALVANGSMAVNNYGEYVPDIKSFSDASDVGESGIGFVCPSLNPKYNEDYIGCELFSSNAGKDDKLGYVIQSYAGYVVEGNLRANGTSGGMGSWILQELLEKGLVDGVIHVKAAERDSSVDPYYAYSISNSVDQILAGSKTRYHVVEISSVIREALDKGGRYALVGVPCVIKAVRRLQMKDKAIKNLIPFTVALVCGHMKSINWSNSLVWGAGIHPSDAARIQYRTKGEGIPARAYVFRAEDKKGISVQKDSAYVVGGKFNAGAHMLPGCEFCDDVVGETADITIGDAWLPRFESDSQGTNLIVIRNKIMNDLIETASGEGRINLVKLSNEEAASSQGGGFRQRREGLSYRLKRESEKGRKLPLKRINPGQYPVTKERVMIYDARTAVTEKSRSLFVEALSENDYSIYVSGMDEQVKKLRYMEIKSSFWSLLYNKINRRFRALFKG
jgi:coenzyme F420 hydrogenase subunit beta